MRKRWLLVVALLVVLVLFHWGYLGNFSGLPVVSAVVDAIDRGVRLTHTTLDDDGSVDADPHALAQEAATAAGVAVSDDEYAAARMVRSEQPHDTDEIKELLVHVALNDAAAHGWTLLKALTVSSVASRSGKFGHQTSRRYSTASDPYGADLQVAKKAIADHAAGVDPTGGCQKFVNKWAFKKPESYDTTAASWGKEGFVPVTVPPAPNHLVFFRKSTAPSSPVADATSDNLAEDAITDDGSADV